MTFTERTGHLRVAFPEDSSAEAEQFSQPEVAVAQVVVAAEQCAQPEVAVVLVAQEEQ